MEACKGAVRNVQICRASSRQSLPCARISASGTPAPKGVIGSMSRSVSKGVIFVDDGVLIAVILSGRHDADFAIDFEEGDRDHQGPGKIESVVLCEAEIRHVRLPPLTGPIPARWRPFDPDPAAVTSAALPQRSQ